MFTIQVYDIISPVSPRFTTRSPSPTFPSMCLIQLYHELNWGNPCYPWDYKNQLIYYMVLPYFQAPEEEFNCDRISYSIITSLVSKNPTYINSYTKERTLASHLFLEKNHGYKIGHKDFHFSSFSCQQWKATGCRSWQTTLPHISVYQWRGMLSTQHFCPVPLIHPF